MPRSILARWALPAALAAITALTVGHAVHAAEQEHAAWGVTVTVWVATHRLAPATVLTDTDVAATTWPARLVPEGAARSTVTGRTVRAAIEPGEPVATARLADPGRSGEAALVPAGWRVIAVATGPARPTLAPGDEVDLYASPDSIDGSAPATRVATGAVVVEVGVDTVSVAIPEARAPAVAAAAAAGSVTIALDP